MSNSDAVLQARAEKILQETLRDQYQEVRAADDLEAELASELSDLSGYVSNADTRTFCILMTSYLEDTLERVFCREWGISGRKSRDEYFGSNGPLSTFSQRISVATALRWISNSISIEAKVLRKIRNELAHRHKVHFLSKPPLEDLMTAIKPREETFDSIEGYTEALRKLDREKRLRLRVFCASALIAGQVISRARMLRQGLFSLDREGGYDSLMEIEQRIISITVDHCFLVVGLKR